GAMVLGGEAMRRWAMGVEVFWILSSGARSQHIHYQGLIPNTDSPTTGSPIHRFSDCPFWQPGYRLVICP
ncbi:MAG TPA: hypothetical protein VEX38_04555, partial [Fimbriimonadaceae bacterium]|nr:hypothetical protein [Fimbriimonadaceae bacterium]